MTTAVRSFALATLLLGSLLTIACGGSDAQPGESAIEIGNVVSECIDEDGDGFGENCDDGPDCDDTDDTVFEQCGVCLDTEEGCACDPGTEPVQCILKQDLETNLCVTGVRSCRDGQWTACEGIAEF